MKKIGRQVHFIETSEDNPRNGEGAFIRLKDGSIMFGYSEFTGNDRKDDDARSKICIFISEDEGETWSDKKILFDTPEDSMNIMCLTFMRMQNEDIGAFYIIKNNDGTDRIVFRRSSDEGESWSEPINCLACLDRDDYYVVNNDRVIRLSNGRILMPVARHTIYTEKDCFMPGELCFFFSDDDGYTWQKTETELICPFVNNPDGFQEPGIYELENGRIWCYIRTDTGFQFECFSEDSGMTWNIPEPNLFFSSPCSPMHVKDCGDITVAVFNPVPEHILREENDLWGRTPYVLAASFDKGRTFLRENIFYLEDDLNNGYCYPAIFSAEDYLLVAYYHSNNGECCLGSTKMIKVSYDEIKGDSNV